MARWLRIVSLTAPSGAETQHFAEKSAEMFSRKLCSILAAAAVGGTALSAPAIATPLAHAPETATVHLSLVLSSGG